MSKSFIEPISKYKAEEYPFRTTCYKMDQVWHVLEANLKIDPPDCDLTEGTLPCEVMTTIFSKEPLDLCNKPPEVVEEPQEGEEMIEVTNPRTGAKEMISRADPTLYSAGGFKARKPKDIPPFEWQSMSVKARREAVGEEQVKIAAKEAEKRLSLLG